MSEQPETYPPTDILDGIAPPEAGISFNFQMLNKAGLNVGVTLRWPDLRGHAEYMAHVKAFLRDLINDGWQFPNAPLLAPAKADGPHVPLVAPANGNAAVAASVVQTAAEVPFAVGTTRAVKMVVIPRADDKVNVQFFGEGRKYPDLYATKTAAQFAMLLSGCGEWTPEHFTGPHEYKLEPPYTLTWHYSDKANSKGNLYKDIDRIDLADAA